MSRLTKHVDRAILAWMMEAPDPAALLVHIEQAFIRSGGRLGYMRTGHSLEQLSGGREDLEHVVLMECGTLTGMLHVREDPPALNWDRGTLSIWRGGDAMPATLVHTLSGRTLGEVVDHPFIPADAVVTQTEEGDPWLRLQCRNFSTTIEEARILAGQTGAHA